MAPQPAYTPSAHPTAHPPYPGPQNVDLLVAQRFMFIRHPGLRIVAGYPADHLAAVRIPWNNSGPARFCFGKSIFAEQQAKPTLGPHSSMTSDTFCVDDWLYFGIEVHPVPRRKDPPANQSYPHQQQRRDQQSFPSKQNHIVIYSNPGNRKVIRAPPPSPPHPRYSRSRRPSSSDEGTAAPNRVCSVFHLSTTLPVWLPTSSGQYRANNVRSSGAAATTSRLDAKPVVQ